MTNSLSLSPSQEFDILIKTKAFAEANDAQKVELFKQLLTQKVATDNFWRNELKRFF